jgi:sec-independent protein translocase protein TatC
MTIIEHLEELRARLIKCLIALAIATALSFVFTSQVLYTLIAPAGIKPVFLRPTEMLVTYFRVALLAGATLSMPVIVYQGVQFVLPGLTRSERAYVHIVVPGATLSFIAGISFAYYVMLPFALRYLLSFGGDLAEAKWAISEYISFVTRLLFWSGVTFEAPMLLFLLARLRIVTPQFLSEHRKLATLVIAIAAAVITPTPDPVNMLVVMLPLLFMYEIGVLLARLAYRLP